MFRARQRCNLVWLLASAIERSGKAKRGMDIAH